MIRALFRLLSMIALSVAVIMAVVDATRSIAAEALVLTTLGSSWKSVAPALLEALEGSMAQNLPAFLRDAVEVAILAQPGFAVFAVLALLLALVGRRPAGSGRSLAYGR